MRALILGLLFSLSALSLAAEARSYVGGRFTLELDGAKAGFLQSVDGGGISAEVTEESAPPVFDKHVGPAAFDQFEVQLGLSMGKPLMDWIQASLDMKYQRKSGEIAAADFKRKVRRVSEFNDALITAIRFPACDALAKEYGFVALRFAPTVTRQRPGDGSRVLPPDDMTQRQWHPEDFRFTLDGIDCAEVLAIDPIIVEMPPLKPNDPQPPRPRIGNLRLTATGRTAAALIDWADDFIIKGNNDPLREKTGALRFLEAQRGRELLGIEFTGLGIFSITPKPEPEDPEKIEVRLYAETVRLSGQDPNPPKPQ